jgi:Arc/MetJ-type ribon-helix-helix transcriptional regulator
MTTISVQLPEDVRVFAESFAKQNGYGSVEDFVSSLLSDVRDQQLALEADLLEGLGSGSSEARSEDDWRQLRLRVAGKVSD